MVKSSFACLATSFQPDRKRAKTTSAARGCSLRPGYMYADCPTEKTVEKKVEVTVEKKVQVPVEIAKPRPLTDDIGAVKSHNQSLGK